MSPRDEGASVGGEAPLPEVLDALLDMAADGARNAEDGKIVDDAEKYIRGLLALRELARLRASRSVETPGGGVYGALMDALESAWGLIANVHGGDWDRASEEWREAAIRWRDENWHPLVTARASHNLAEHPRPPAPPGAAPEESGEREAYTYPQRAYPCVCKETFGHRDPIPCMGEGALFQSFYCVEKRAEPVETQGEREAFVAGMKAATDVLGFTPIAMPGIYYDEWRRATPGETDG